MTAPARVTVETTNDQLLVTATNDEISLALATSSHLTTREVENLVDDLLSEFAHTIAVGSYHTEFTDREEVLVPDGGQEECPRCRMYLAEITIRNTDTGTTREVCRACARVLREVEEIEVVGDLPSKDGLIADGGKPTSETYSSGRERRVRCSCGLRYGWFDPDDADHLAAHHAENCDGEVEYKEREKEGKNYSDTMGVTRDDYLLSVCRHCDDGRDYECKFCGRGYRLPGPRNSHQEVCTGP